MKVPALTHRAIRLQNRLLDCLYGTLYIRPGFRWVVMGLVVPPVLLTLLLLKLVFPGLSLSGHSDDNNPGTAPVPAPLRPNTPGFLVAARKLPPDEGTILYRAS